MKAYRKQVSTTDHVATGASARRGRLKAGISLREVAGKMGFSAPFISDLEHGRRCWTEDKLRRYNDAIGANWNEALT